MEFDKILDELNQASLFELYRLNQAIWTQLEDPGRNKFVKRQLQAGQEITYFDSEENKLIEAVIVSVKRTRALVKNKHDGKIWNIPFYQINIEGIDPDIKSDKKKGIDRKSLKVGEYVGFTDNDGHEVFGQVIKLNPKTAGVLVGKTRWRVYYSSLSPVLDSQTSGNLILEGEAIKNE